MDEPPRPWRYMLGFAVGGPLVGYFLLGLTGGPGGLVATFFLAFLGFPVLVAYATGVIPAALTGWVAGWSLRWGHVWIFLLVATMAGAVFTIASSLVFSHRPTLAGLALPAALGGGSGLICAGVALGRSGLRLRLPAFTHVWPAGNVLLAVLGTIMIVMVATLLLPVL